MQGQAKRGVKNNTHHVKPLHLCDHSSPNSTAHCLVLSRALMYCKCEEENEKVPCLDIIHGYDKTQTGDAKWLQIDKPLFKLYRPNSYDIGGTYVQDVRDFWFTFSTETVGNIMLLHLFVDTHQEKNFNVSTSACHQDLSIDKRKQTVHLTQILEHHKITAVKNTLLNYVTTYSFNELDVQAFESKTLFISIKISHSNQVNLGKAIEEVKLTHDCHALLKEPDTADFIIESETGVQIPAHKHILKTHSKVFEVMFKEENEYLLKQEDHMVETCCTEDLRDFLEFMYTGTIVNIANCNPRIMLMLADKYEVLGLREFAENMLHLDLNIDNCFEMLNDADMFNSDKLKYAALKFIKQNAPKLEFKNLSQQLVNKKLIYEVADYIVVRDSI